MSERFKEPVLKTGDSKGPWVRIPPSPPYSGLAQLVERSAVNRRLSQVQALYPEPCTNRLGATQPIKLGYTEWYPRGQRGSPAKGVGG